MLSDADTTKVNEEFKGLCARAVQGNMRLFNRFSSLVADAAKEISSGTQSRAAPSPAEILNRFAELNLAYWAAVSDHGQAFANEMASAVERALGLKTRTATRSEQHTGQVCIAISAHAGAQAVAAFQVENTFSEVLNVSFQAGAIVSPDGVPLKSKPVEFKPGELTLAPRTQALVQATIDVPAECKPNETYTLGVKPMGFPLKEISIRLTIVAPAAKSPDKAGKVGRPKKRG